MKMEACVELTPQVIWMHEKKISKNKAKMVESVLQSSYWKKILFPLLEL